MEIRNVTTSEELHELIHARENDKQCHLSLGISAGRISHDFSDCKGKL